MKITPQRKVNIDQYIHCQASVHLNLVDLLQFTERKMTTILTNLATQPVYV